MGQGFTGVCVHVCMCGVCLTKKTFEDAAEDEISRNKDVAV